VSDNWASDEWADAVARENAENPANNPPLLDPRGVTSHKPYAQLEQERWDAGMKLAEHLQEGGLVDEAKAFRECHSHQTVMQCGGCHKVSRFWNRCDIFYCPQCSPTLADKRLKGLMFFVEAMKQTKHIVLTFVNVPTLTSAYLKWCRKKLSQFRRRKIFGTAVSGLWAMEITNEGRGWHVHFHLVVDCGWIDVRALSAQWQSVCGDGSRIVWIEDATRGGLKANLPRYVSKYASKGFRPQDWSGDQFCEFVRALKGGRTFGVFGKLLGKRKEWREWLTEFVRTKKTCECGCCVKQFYSHQEWEWKQMKREQYSGRASLPPPTTKAQLVFSYAG
jgi:hypothetical protein